VNHEQSLVGERGLTDAPVSVDEVLARASRREHVARLLQRGGAAIVLAGVVVLGTIFFGGRFLSANNVLNIVEDSSFLGLIAVGMTMVIMSGGIDLSVGSMLALGGVSAAWAAEWGGSPAAVVVPLVLCGAIGLANGLLVARARMAPFIVTLAALLFARGLAFAISDEGSEVFIVPPGEWFSQLGQGSVLGVQLPVIFAIFVFLLGWVVLNRTRFGLSVSALGGSEDAASLMGLPVDRIKVALYTASALLAGIAGMLIASRSSSGISSLGVGWELQAIAAVVIGGTLLSGGLGSLAGTAAGVLLLGVIGNLINQVGTLSSYLQEVVSGVFLLIVVVIQTYVSREQRL
jgi:galactofuranose transport system permease protein